MKIVKRNILKIGYIIVVFFLWNAKVYITDVNNIKEISAAFQEIFIFLSGSFLAIVGVNSFFPENRFIRSLRQLNVDLHLLKKFINLTFFSIVLVFLPSFLLFFDKKDNSILGRILIIFEIVVFLIFCVELIKLAVQVRKIFKQTIEAEITERKK
ncbi:MULTISPECIES: hypothetical protein [Streptococcus]|uniref:Uncharacterized protein n=2 Tax=Streptococcus TaxID=1301 RepID=A0A3Q9F478_9STRE|nr:MULTISPECIES: hypothetical protein [Streptococcus]AZQ42224.1 hypothetical protein EHW89_07095 [Streptococcus periodonticum]MDB8661961.1 hypothetical protein [Streptococcus anginosus]